jgi:hypothetical protein
MVLASALNREFTFFEASESRFPEGFPVSAYFGRVQILEVTEQGVAMLSSVLRSARAVQVNIAIMRTFVHLRALPGPPARICGARSSNGKAL